MLAQIVVLYMVYVMNMPVWCRILVWISLFFKIACSLVAFLKGIYNAGKESKED
jgi:uncharacterized protein (DUF983 family)